MAAPISLSQAIEEFLNWQELDRHRSPGTIREYRKDLVGFAAFAGGDEGVPDVAGIDRDLLRAYQRHLARLTARRRGAERPLAVATRHRRLVTVRSFLRFAAREEWLAGDLGTTIDLPRLPDRLPKPLEPEVRDQLLGALPAGTLPEKRDRALVISFQPASKDSRDNRLSANGARHICRQLAHEHALASFHPHQLRHTLATLLQETVGDARLTAETLGHRGLGSVAGYTKVSDRRKRAAYAELERGGL